ncbi:hypothetical protein QZH41_011616 [Actinostola sp. cb2023]|nr:hypothetical protein QZH41_011616 [Actinostola sp. cb2023]
MSSLKIVVFPGLEEVSYTTEKKATLGNPVLEFLSEGSSVTQEQLYTIEQLASKQLESENRRYAKNSREFVCPPILDLAMTTRASELQPVNKPRRIFNGFFPSKIRTSNSCPNSTRDMKSKQELFEEIVPDSTTSPYQNGVYQGRTGSRSTPKSEPAVSWSSNQQSSHERSHRDRKIVYSLRNGSPSPWINRYQLKKNSISSYNAMELKNQAMSYDSTSRGLSR